MKIDIQTINFNATEGLLGDVRSVLEKFTQYDDRITGADVYLKMLENHTTNTRTAEIKVYLPGGSLFAEHQADSFYEALHQAAEKVKVQVLKRKEQLQQKR